MVPPVLVAICKQPPPSRKTGGHSGVTAGSRHGSCPAFPAPALVTGETTTKLGHDAPTAAARHAAFLAFISVGNVVNRSQFVPLCAPFRVFVCWAAGVPWRREMGRVIGADDRGATRGRRADDAQQTTRLIGRRFPVMTAGA